MNELSFLRFETEQTGEETGSGFLRQDPLLDGGKRIPLYQVGEKVLRMKVSAACVAIDGATGLFSWAEPLDGGNEIYPLDEWGSDFNNLDFDFCEPLKQWAKKGLHYLWLANSNQLPQSEQKDDNHPLRSLVEAEGLDLSLNAVSFHEYQGLTRFSKLNKTERVKDEYYPRYEKTIARVKRRETGKPDPIALAFLFAMAILGEEDSPPAEWRLTPVYW